MGIAQGSFTEKRKRSTAAYFGVSCLGIIGSAAKSVGKWGFSRVETMDLPTLFEEISWLWADLAVTNKLLNSVPSLVKFPWSQPPVDIKTKVSKQKLRFSISSIYWNKTFVLMLIGGWDQPDGSPCSLKPWRSWCYQGNVFPILQPFAMENIVVFDKKTWFFFGKSNRNEAVMEKLLAATEQQFFLRRCTQCL